MHIALFSHVSLLNFNRGRTERNCKIPLFFPLKAFAKMFKKVIKIYTYTSSYVV
nr:MAG TPA: hypothetical protein [Caudoviricetes sp.]